MHTDAPTRLLWRLLALFCILLFGDQFGFSYVDMLRGSAVVGPFLFQVLKFLFLLIIMTIVIIFISMITTKAKTMKIKDIANLAGMTETELKKSIIKKVRVLESLGMSRSEAEQKVKEIFFAQIKEA